MPRDASNSELTTKTRPASAVASDCAATSAMSARTPPWMLSEVLSRSGRWSASATPGSGTRIPSRSEKGCVNVSILGSSAMRASSLSRTSPGRGEPMNVPNEIAKGRSAPGTQNVVSPTVVVRPVFRSRPSISIGPSGGVSMIWARRSAVSEMRGASRTPRGVPPRCRRTSASRTHAGTRCRAR